MEEVKELGKLIRVDLTVNERLDPPFDTIGFLDPKGNWTEYVGYSKNASQMTYYFRPDLQCKILKAVTKHPFKRYFEYKTREIELPLIKDNSHLRIWNFINETSFSYSLAGTDLPDKSLKDKLISENSKVKVNAPQELLDKFSPSRITEPQHD